MIRINFFGDFVAHNVNSLKMDIHLDELISQADINVVNLEAPAIGTIHSPSEKIATYGYLPIEKSGPSLFQTQGSPSWLTQNGFGIVSLANNHIMDYGVKGLLDTKKLFKDSIVTGAGNWQEAYTPCVVTIKEKKIAVFALSQCEFGNLTDEWDPTSEYGVAWINHPRVDAVIRKTRAEVDFLIVYAHAGLENVEQPLPEWRDRYRQFIDLGCDAVIASHPHIPQGWEFYHEHPIVYSLGNFYFPNNIANTDGWNKSICASVLLDDSNVGIDIAPLTFSEDIISVADDSGFKEYLERVNQTLADRDAYMEYVNARCLEVETKYHSRFVASGIGKLTNWQDFKRYLGLRLRQPEALSIAHIVNNIRCETHRWCYIRAVKLKNNQIL